MYDCVVQVIEQLCSSVAEEAGYAPAVLGAVVEVMLVLEYPFAVEDATEFIHWLVRGAQWAECEGLASCLALQSSLVEECISIRNTKAATKYATSFGLLSSQTRLVHEVAQPQQDLKANCSKFALPHGVQIVIVADNTSFGQCVDHLASSETPIGLDAEWKPFVHASDANPVALLQLSNAECVWLLDLIELDKNLLPRLWQVLSRCVVVGFGLEGDLKQLKSSFPEMHIRLNHAVELQDMLAQESLSRVCKSVLQCELDKAMQTSDWSARPLSDEQVAYAAADSYVLLLILAAFLGPPNACNKILDAASNYLRCLGQQLSDGARQWARPLDVDHVRPSGTYSETALQRTDVERALRQAGLKYPGMLNDALDGTYLASRVPFVCSICLLFLAVWSSQAWS